MKLPFGLALATGSLLSCFAQTAKAPAIAKERANVGRIHDRIQSHSQTAAKPQPYKITIPNATISYSMVPIPAGEFVMGSDSKEDERPTHKVRVDAFWMQAHEVTWDEYRLFMFASQAGELTQKDEIVDAVSRPTHPYVEMSFGMGLDGLLRSRADRLTGILNGK